MLGETLKIKREHKKAVEEITKSIATYQIMAYEGTTGVRDHRRRLFDLLYEKYPGLADYEFSVNHKTFELIITGKSKKNGTHDE